MYCTKCGTQINPPSANFCSKCGTAVYSNPQQRSAQQQVQPSVASSQRSQQNQNELGKAGYTEDGSCGCLYCRYGQAVNEEQHYCTKFRVPVNSDGSCNYREPNEMGLILERMAKNIVNENMDVINEAIKRGDIPPPRKQ